MADKEETTNGNPNPVQPSQPAPSAAADPSPSDPNLVSIIYLKPGEGRCFLPKLLKQLMI